MQAAAASNASPTTVTSSWRSETKIAAGRHFTAVAGTSAIVKHAIAKARPSRISSERRSKEPPDSPWNVCLTLTAASGGATVTLGTREVLFFALALRYSVFFGFDLGGAPTFGFAGITGAVEGARVAGGL